MKKINKIEVINGWGDAYTAFGRPNDWRIGPNEGGRYLFPEDFENEQGDVWHLKNDVTKKIIVT